MRAGAAFTLLLAVAAPAGAQHLEVAPLTSFGYTPGVDLEKRAAGIRNVRIAGGFTWGGQLGYFFAKRMGAELQWAQQETSIALETSSGSADLFDMKAGQLHGEFVYQFGADHARWRPFLLAGLGATFFSATHLQSETKLSWALGAGVKCFPRKHLGAKLQARYKPTRLKDASEDFCDPFGFCQQTLGQEEFMGGLVFRF